MARCEQTRRGREFERRAKKEMEAIQRAEQNIIVSVVDICHCQTLGAFGLRYVLDCPQVSVSLTHCTASL